LDFQASGAHDVAASLRVTGMELVDDRRPELELEMKSDEKGVGIVLAIADSLGDIVRCNGTVPAEVRVYRHRAFLPTERCRSTRSWTVFHRRKVDRAARRGPAGQDHLSERPCGGGWDGGRARGRGESVTRVSELAEVVRVQN